LDKNVCEDFVDKTFEYFYFFNKVVWRYVNSVNFLAMCNIGDHNEFKLNKDKNFLFIDIDNSYYLE